MSGQPIECACGCGKELTLADKPRRLSMGYVAVRCYLYSLFVTARQLAT